MKLYEIVPALKTFIEDTILVNLTLSDGKPVRVYDYLPIWEHMRPVDFACVGFELGQISFGEDTSDQALHVTIPVNFSVAVRNDEEVEVLYVLDSIIGRFETESYSQTIFYHWIPANMVSSLDLFQDEFANELHLSIGLLTVNIDCMVPMIDYH